MEKLLPTLQKQDVFLKVHSMSCLGQLVLLGPSIIRALFSCGALATQPSMAGEVTVSRETSTQTLLTHHVVIRNAESGLRQQRQGPNVHKAFQVACPPISAFVEEKV